MFILIISVVLFCVEVQISTKNYNTETMETRKLEKKIERMLKKRPSKTTLVKFLQNNHTIHSVTKISVALKYDDPYPYPDAPPEAYWVIGIIAMGPIHFGKNYTVFFDKKGNFLTYQSYELVSPGLDF